MSLFNRDAKGYLDGLEMDEKTLSRFDDAHSAKYLHLCFHPEFIMRVRERDKPLYSTNVGGLYETSFNDGKLKEEVV